jgi:hypothetical protein
MLIIFMQSLKKLVTHCADKILFSVFYCLKSMLHNNLSDPSPKELSPMYNGSWGCLAKSVRNMRDTGFISQGNVQISYRKEELV